MDRDSGCKARKRVASRQLTRDDSESSESDESPRLDSGSFLRASEEVLASRRIIKVRRGPPARIGANPFSGISLVAPASSQEAQIVNSQIVNSSSACSDAKSQLQKMAQGDACSCKVGPPTQNGNTSESIGNELNPPKTEAGVSETSEDGIPVSEKNGTATSGQSGTVNPSQEEPTGAEQTAIILNEHGCSAGSKNSVVAGFASFCSTGSSVPTSFSSVGPTFTFGSLSSAAVASSESHSFAPVFGRSGISSFGSAPGVSCLARVATPAVSLPEVQIQTGEEQETTIFRANAILFEYVNKAWKERGKGELKLNVSRENGRRPRLIMRSRGNYRLLLNAGLYPHMKVSKMDNRGVSIACTNSAVEGKSGLRMYGLRMSNNEVVADFLHAFESQKGSETCTDTRSSNCLLEDQERDEEKEHIC